MKLKILLFKYKLKYIKNYLLLIFVIFGILIIFSLNAILPKLIVFVIKFASRFTHNCHGDDNNCKINYIESLIQLSENDIECKIPNLPIDNPEIMKYYHFDGSQLSCSGKEDWIQCIQSFCSVKESIKLVEGRINCTYTDIYRKNDYKTMYGPKIETDGNYTLNQSDFVIVFCNSSNGGRWFGVGAGIRSILKMKLKTNLKSYNVLIFGIDSLSRNAFIRKLPQTYAYLTETLQSNILEGYNIVGDGTAQALIPILTGHNELELPETRRRISGSGYADLYPLVWNIYKKFGYVTSFNEDEPEIGTFQYRLNGFEKQPTEHYMRTLYLKSKQYNTDKYCIGKNMGHVVMLNYVKNFMASYENIAPRFTFSFHSGLSHSSMNLIGNADPDVHRWLINLNDQSLLENTILIMMSDHGNRFAAVRNTLQGKQEERLPFFSFTFPKSFKTQNPTAYKNFQQNLQVLTTPFDIHETLLDILRLQHLNVTPTLNKHQQKTPPRGISLFQVIPKNRSCSMAYIEPHWCTCLKWSNLNRTDKFVQELAENVVDTINNYTNYFRNICESLSLLKVNWAMTLTPNENLIRFKEHKDFDGFVADMSSKMRIDIKMYQVQFSVLPGNSIFEATIGHNAKNNKFAVQMSQISRINRYGDQANCIYNISPDLRKYCYCK